jgi:hypothetical protein
MLTAEDLQHVDAAVSPPIPCSRPTGFASPLRTVATGIATALFLHACAVGAAAAVLSAARGTGASPQGRA